MDQITVTFTNPTFGKDYLEGVGECVDRIDYSYGYAFIRMHDGNLVTLGAKELIKLLSGVYQSKGKI